MKSCFSAFVCCSICLQSLVFGQYPYGETNYVIGSTCNIVEDADLFIPSIPFNGKTFLFPWDSKLRKGDWFENFGLCRKYCAEMVTIHSSEENDFFNNWIRSFGLLNTGVWLGGQFPYVTGTNHTFKWVNGEVVNYSPIHPGEPNETGFTCLLSMFGGGANANNWGNWYCTINTINFACQRACK